MSKWPKPDLFNPVHLLAFGFGSGISPIAPGTAGTLVAIPLYYLMSFLNLYFYLSVLLIIIVFGIWLCDRTSKDLNVHDHPGIVWDEIAGFMIAMVAVPVSWLTILLGFVLFRLFDIWKPWPIGWLDRQVSGGLGIMLDDVVAGCFALFVLHLLMYLDWITVI